MKYAVVLEASSEQVFVCPISGERDAGELESEFVERVLGEYGFSTSNCQWMVTETPVISVMGVPGGE